MSETHEQILKNAAIAGITNTLASIPSNHPLLRIARVGGGLGPNGSITSWQVAEGIGASSGGKVATIGQI